MTAMDAELVINCQCFALGSTFINGVDRAADEVGLHD